jgi:hypothetical protein
MQILNTLSNYHHLLIQNIILNNLKQYQKHNPKYSKTIKKYYFFFEDRSTGSGRARRAGGAAVASERYGGSGGRAVRRAVWRVVWRPSGAVSGVAAARVERRRRREQEQSGKWKSEASDVRGREKRRHLFSNPLYSLVNR